MTTKRTMIFLAVHYWLIMGNGNGSRDAEYMECLRRAATDGEKGAGE